MRKLDLGERVCHVGERGDFAIIDWRKQARINGKSEIQNSNRKTPEAAFVRLVDLWPPEASSLPDPNAAKPKDTLEQAQDHMKAMRNELVREDIYGPFRPLVDFIFPPTECVAGEEICEKVEAEMRKLEEKKKGAECSSSCEK